jgi:hypothetical protein
MIRTYSLLLYVGLLFISCGADQDEPIPSYLYIKPFAFTTKPNQGTSNQKLIDAWIYVNGVYVGAYELPVHVPVLFSGLCSIKIFPGYRKDGKITLPTIFPIGKEYNTEVDLTIMKTDTISPVTSYEDGLKFPFNENFDGRHFFNQDLDNDVQTKLVLSSGSEAFEGSNAGYIELSETNPLIAVQYDYASPIPSGDIPVIVELHFKSDISFNIGFLGYTGNLLHKNLIVATVFPKKEWTKVYFNFRELINEANSSEYRIAIQANFDPNLGQATQRIFVDNFKVVHR